MVGAGDVGQTGAPAYEERQRAPGDWDAWVSQGPVTLHSREHLGTTDRGVIMCRKLVRQGIRAVAEDDTATARHHLLPLCRRTFNAFPASIGWPSQRIAL